MNNRVSCLLMVALLPVAILASGWAICVLWGWFVSPLFGLPAITILQAYGLSLVLAALRGWRKSEPFESNYEAAVAVTASLLSPAMLVGLGWLIRQF